jgi:hypothetical protein
MSDIDITIDDAVDEFTVGGRRLILRENLL